MLKGRYSDLLERFGLAFRDWVGAHRVCYRYADDRFVIVNPGLYEGCETITTGETYTTRQAAIDAARVLNGADETALAIF